MNYFFFFYSKCLLEVCKAQYSRRALVIRLTLLLFSNHRWRWHRLTFVDKETTVFGFKSRTKCLPTFVNSYPVIWLVWFVLIVNLVLYFRDGLAFGQRAWQQTSRLHNGCQIKLPHKGSSHANEFFFSIQCSQIYVRIIFTSSSRIFNMLKRYSSLTNLCLRNACAQNLSNDRGFAGEPYSQILAETFIAVHCSNAWPVYSRPPMY